PGASRSKAVMQKRYKRPACLAKEGFGYAANLYLLTECPVRVTRNRPMRNALLLAALLLPASGLMGPALAGFNVCNKTGTAVRVALGRFDGAQWTSEGWWVVKPADCAA